MPESGSTRVTLLALLFGVLGTVVALFAVMRPTDDDAEDRARASEQRANETVAAVAGLSARLDALEARVEQASRARRREAAEDAGRATPSPRAADAPDITPRMAELEARVEALERATPRRERASARDREEAPKPEELERVALDPSREPIERIQALRHLRNVSGGRSRDVVLAMIDLYRRDPAPEIRADIFRQLGGVTEPDLMPVLIDALRDDPDPKVREEAAETLSDFDDPQAVAALELAAEHDPDEDVRDEARKRLARRRR